MLLPDLPPIALRVLHVGGYWRGINDLVHHMMLGLRKAGAHVYELDTDRHPEMLDTDGRPYDRGTFGPVWLRGQHVGEIVRSFLPHLVICNAGGLSFRPERAASMREERCLLGFAHSDPDVFAPATSRIAANFDLFLTASPDMVPRYQELGVRAGVFPVGTNTDFFRPVPPRPEMRCEVLILGRAHPDRVEPVRRLRKQFDVHVYGEGWEDHGIPSRGTIYGDDVLAALSSAGIVVVFNRTGGGHRLVKVGLFDFAAAGALVATNRFPEVEKYFEVDREIVAFGSTEELVDRVAHFLDHPEEAKRTRRAGRERVLAEHTWERVWPRILDMAKGIER